MALTRRGEILRDDSTGDRSLESWGHFRQRAERVRFQFAYKAIAASGKSLDIAGFSCTVSQRGANLVYGKVDAMFEVDKGRVLP